MGNIESGGMGKAVGRADDEIIKGVVIIRTAVFLLFLLFVLLVSGRFKPEKNGKAENLLAGFFNKLGKFLRYDFLFKFTD